MNIVTPSNRWTVWVSIPCLLLIFLTIQSTLNQQTDMMLAKAAPFYQSDFAGLANKTEQQGSLRVIVKLDVPFESGSGTLVASRVQQRRIESAQNQVLTQMADTKVNRITQFKYIPFMAFTVDADALEVLATLPQVKGIEEDVPIPATLSSSTEVIGAVQAWNNGYTGAGQTVAILDTGVDVTHPAFTTGGSRIVAEGCYSTSDSGYQSVSACPGGVSESTAPGSGDDCVDEADGLVGAQSDCTHGTHVAGIAAGNDGTLFGVARDANIISIQIFSLFSNSGICGGGSSCALTFTSDQIKGLERVYELRNSYNITAVNMSLGGSSPHTTVCDSDSRKAAIDNLRAAGIATIIASGNNGYTDAISKPACISSAISVGSTTDNDIVSSFSNVGSLLDLLAPGSSILAAVPGSGNGTKSGTSMAAPHVTGAWAVYKQAVPNATVDDVLTAFQISGQAVNDSRGGGIYNNLPRINIDQAISTYTPGLNIELGVSQPYALPGELVTYTITVINNTSLTAPDVEIQTTLPENVTLAPTSLSGDADINGITSGSEITWQTGVTLAPNQSLTREFSGFVNPGLTQSAFVNNSATVTSSTLFEPRHAAAVLIVNEIATCDYTEGFESGALGPEWAVHTTQDGRVAVIDDLPSSGTYSLLLDDSVSGDTYSEAAAILNINLNDQAAVFLSFDWYDLADEYDTDFDGVFIRSTPADGWLKIFDFEGTNSSSFQQSNLDIAQLASANNVNLSKQFQIKFSFYDNYPASFENINGGDGYAIDEIELSCEPADLTLNQHVEQMSPDPGQLITYTLVVSNNDPNAVNSAIISSTLPTELTFAGPITLSGGSGIVAQDGSDLPTLVSELSIPGSGQIAISFPVSVRENVKAGTPINLSTAVSLSSSSEWHSDTQMVIVMNVPPYTQPDILETERDTPLTFSPLTNDSDLNGDVLQITAVYQPLSGGTMTTNGNMVTYIPTPTFAGTEQISYVVSDGMGGIATGDLTIHVPNVPPTAQNDATASPPGESIHYPVLINDEDLNEHALTITAVTQPAEGTALIEGDMILYSAPAGFDGTAVIPYTISDGYGGESTAELWVSVSEDANGAPVAQPDFASTNRDQSILLSIMQNDVDPNFDEIELTSLGAAQYGTAVSQNNDVLYTPPAGFIGIDNFVYSIQDVKGALSSATVFVEVGLDQTELISIDPNASTTQFITTNDERVSLAIPAGVLPQTAVQLAYTTLDSSTKKMTVQSLDFFFALNLVDATQTHISNPTFDPPLELTLKYEPAFFPANISEDELNFYFFDSGSQMWEKIEIVSQDLIQNTITVNLYHFTDFALVADYKLYLPIMIRKP